MRGAYRRLAGRHHPDRPGGDADRMAEINAAYAALRAPRPPEVVHAMPAAPVEAASSGRPLGCAPFVAAGVVIAAVTMLVVVALAGGTDSSSPATTPATSAAASAPDRRPAPWREGRLPAASSRLAVSTWRLSPARHDCPLLVPAGADAGGTARVVEVAQGWGVEWGRANEPALFGITASTRPPPGTPGEAALTWADGSRANLRVAGDRLVADLSIRDVDCTYSVFSTAGFENLSEVLGALRFVDV